LTPGRHPGELGGFLRKDKFELEPKFNNPELNFGSIEIIGGSLYKGCQGGIK
jgi:hypothetical protein